MIREKLLNSIKEITTSSMKNLLDEFEKAESALNKTKEELASVQASLETAKAELQETSKVSKDVMSFAHAKKEEALSLIDTASNETARLKNFQMVVNSEVSVAQDKLQEIHLDILKLSKERASIEAEIIVRGNERVKELQKELELRVPALDAKEKELKIKENDLAIVESRWKKVFSEKGMGFKV